MLRMGFICAPHVRSGFPTFFHILSANTFVGMLHAQVRGVESVTPIQRERMEKGDCTVIHGFQKEQAFVVVVRV
jgi:hypothetical protein